MSILNWPKEDRPREKLLQKGEHHLTESELIAIFLQTGVKGQSALDLAKQLLAESGDLKSLLSAPKAVLMQKTGIGPAKYALLRAALELGKRYLRTNIPTGSVLNSSQLTKQFLADRLRHHQNEVFACLFLDNHFRLIQFEELFHGTLNEAVIYPREIAKRGLACHAANIILAHNHPSGNPTPSEADKDITQLIKQALALVEIAVIDHLIIGNPDNFSFAESGLM